ncbi:TetR/AcrR family transcriptional regulator [Luteimonas abyssi]|uniref:TetR/AcrR family transcriptional regulator n=1 Tax=Luteimonas abyssi TaxID=1247514 RepID=UPI000737D6DD|nr:TetR/AcrR family transcriptional regulator [Luteimonas abyssi]
MSGRSDTRKRILEAAESLSQRMGAAHLTLDAVAAEAGVSKGGLLYHFPSKEALLGGMVEHHMEQHRRSLEAARARHPDSPAGYMCAYLEAQMDEQHHRLHEPHAVRSFIAAAVNTPSLLEQPRQLELEHLTRLRAAGPRFIDALLISLVLDGLFFGEAFELLDLDPAERKALLEALQARASAL